MDVTPDMAICNRALAIPSDIADLGVLRKHDIDQLGFTSFHPSEH